MLKRNYFFLIPLLVVMALVFGVLGGAQAKNWPSCPSGDDVDLVGPAIVGHMRFYVTEQGQERIAYVLRCKNVEVPGDTDLVWKINGALQETDLVEHGPPDTRTHLIFGPPDVFDPLLEECYNVTDVAFCLAFGNVHNFVQIEAGEEYEADVILFRAIEPRH